MTVVSAPQLAKTFVEARDTLVDEFDLVEFLHMLTDRACGLVNASAAGLVLADQDGRLKFTAGSDENVKQLELFQLQRREGPCLEAFHTGQPVINVDLDGAPSRWPRFEPRAVGAGFQSVRAFPMRVRSQAIGAIDIFGDTKGGDFQSMDVPIVQALADVAAIGLLQERTIRRGKVRAEQLQDALNDQIIIEQAKGAIAQAHDISVDEAFVKIRRYAHRHSLRLTDVAYAVVTDPTSLNLNEPT